MSGVTRLAADGIAMLLQAIGGALLFIATLVAYLVVSSHRFWVVGPRNGLPPPGVLLPLVGVSAIIGLGLVGRRKWGAVLLATCGMAMAGVGLVDTLVIRVTPLDGLTLVLTVVWVGVLVLPTGLACLGWTSLRWR
jgi:hypothetical protein